MVEGARAGLAEDAVAGPEARDGWSDARDGAGDVVSKDVGRFVAGEEALVAGFFVVRAYWAWANDGGREVLVSMESGSVQRWLL